MMMTTEAIEKRLGELPCPICGSSQRRATQRSRFGIRSAGQAGYAEQLYTARCLDCAYLFQVSTPTRPIRETRPDVAIWLDGLSCPVCQESGVEFDFRCAPSVRDCFYFVTCKRCHHPFHEKASMEAFE